MKKTILFDLDDTLLNNSMEQFLPKYLHLLANHLQDFYPPEKLPGLIVQSTENMVKNLDPEITLEDCFDESFYPKLNKNKSQLAPTINNFYENIFPTLQTITGPIDGVPDLISDLENDHTNIAITTNPLFPIKAIHHRLEWAGIPHIKHQFHKITAYEEFHFSKPHPEYLAETLAQMGWPEGLILSVGNDWEMDIIPAEKLGIPTYYLGTPPPNPPISRHPLSKNGDHSGIQPWIESFPPDHSSFECAVNPEAYLAILRSVPAALDTLLKNIDSTTAKRKLSIDEWSLTEIISHLVDVDGEVNIPRIKVIQQNNEPFFSAMITDEWAETRNYQANPFKETLLKFIQTRKKLIQEIESLNESDWEKTITHTIFGPTSVLEIIKFMAQHDRIHVQQIYKNLIY